MKLSFLLIFFITSSLFGSVKHIAVLNFQGETGEPSKEGNLLNLQWTHADARSLAQQIRFAIKNDPDLQTMKTTHIDGAGKDLKESTQIAKDQSSDYLIYGSIKSFQIEKRSESDLYGKIACSLTIVDVTHAQVIFSKDINPTISESRSKNYGEFLQRLKNQTAEHITEIFKEIVNPATVESSTLSHVYLHPTPNATFKPGMLLDIFMPMKIDRDTATGDIIGDTEYKIARARVSKVLEYDNLIEGLLSNYKMPIPQGAVCRIAYE